MSHKEEVGRKVAQTVATKAYDVYGDKIPIDIDPNKVADYTYDAIQRHREKARKRERHHRLLKLGLGVVACACVVTVVVPFVLTHAKKL